MMSNVDLESGGLFRWRSNQGVSSYEELHEKMGKGHARVLRSIGASQFRELIGRLPLTLNDEAVFEVATSQGWSDEFLQPIVKPKGKAKASARQPTPVEGGMNVVELLRAGNSAVRVSTIPAPPQMTQAVGQVAAATVSGGTGGATATPSALVAPIPGPAIAGPAVAPIAGPTPVARIAGPELGAPIAGPAPALLAGVAEVASEEPCCCAICQDHVQSGEESIALPCSHLFHKYCVDTWLASGSGDVSRCPVCRTPHQLPSGRHHHEPEQSIDIGFGEEAFL